MITFLVAAFAPAIGSADFNQRALVMHQTEYPAVFRLVDAARKGDESAFQQYVTPGATISLPNESAIPFTSATIRDLATRCSTGDSVGIRFLSDVDELSIYWRCPAGSPSLVTTLSFKNGKIVHASTGMAPAVIHTLPSPERGSR